MRRIAILGGLCLLFTLALASNAPAIGAPFAPVYNGSVLRTMALAGNRTALERLSAPVTNCVGEDDPNAPVAVQEAAMECMVNFAREQAGLPRLSDSRKLNGSSGNKAGDVLRCNQFSHEACGRDFLYWFRRAGYLSGRCWWAGENLAWGTGSLGSVRAVMKAWLRSPSHRANLLGEEYEQFGISLRVGGLSGSPDAHLWVNHFGRRC
jgi:uncharacterized protein YkwD